MNKPALNPFPPKNGPSRWRQIASGVFSALALIMAVLCACCAMMFVPCVFTLLSGGAVRPLVTMADWSPGLAALLLALVALACAGLSRVLDDMAEYFKL